MYISVCEPSFFPSSLFCNYKVRIEIVINLQEHMDMQFLTIYRSPLKNGALKNELENVPPPLGKRVRKHMSPRTQPQANLSSPNGVISSFAGTSSPPRKKVANNPHAKQRTLPLRPPMPSKSDVANDSRVAVLLPNIACAIRPPSSLPQGNKFRDVTTIPAR